MSFGRLQKQQHAVVELVIEARFVMDIEEDECFSACVIAITDDERDHQNDGDHDDEFDERRGEKKCKETMLVMDD